MRKLFKEFLEGYDPNRLYKKHTGGFGPGELLDWKKLMCFRPPLSVQQSVKARGVRIHRIEDAISEHVSLDYYSIRIRKFPTVDAGILTAKQLFVRLRISLNDFVNPWLAEFSPFEDLIDRPKWYSSLYPENLGAVLLIGITGEPGGAAVVASHSTETNWIFTTVYTNESGDHPVSGNREFGYFETEEPGVYDFYTRGADALTGLFDPGLPVYFAQNLLWVSFQEKVFAYVNKHKGKAEIVPPIIHRPPLLETLREYCIEPDTPWLD